jgi:hypothetical protein
VVPGTPIPVGAPEPPPPPIDGDDEAEDEEEDESDCGIPFPVSPTSYPSPSDIPTWGQSPPQTGGTCQWSGTIDDYTNTFAIAIASGQTSFTADLYQLLDLGSYSYTFDGATVQAYSVSATGWTVSFSPSSPSVSSTEDFVDFDIPTNPLPS